MGTYKVKNPVYGSDQFEIIGIAKRGPGDPKLRSKTYTENDYLNYNDLNAGPVLIINNVPKNTYPRILIKHKKQQIDTDQFEIAGCSYQYGDCGKHIDDTTWNGQINGKEIYKRIFIKKKPVKKRDNEKNLKQMKDCLLIANCNAVTYKEIFPFIKEGKLRASHFNETYIYETPNENTLESNRDYVRAKGLDPDKYIKVPACTWLTTLPTPNKKKLTLTATYDPDKNPKYDNYDAIEVSKIKDIPYDYDGVMGVPITILGYDLDNVEIEGLKSGADKEKIMKDCLIIGNSNGSTYKEVFPLIKNKQLRWGYNWVKTFTDADGNETPFGNICWFTSLPATNKRKLVLTQSYDPKKYPKYDNYDAIEVGRIKDIPYDYEGVMGVPITILGYDLENVEIVNMSTMSGKSANYWTYVDGKPYYSRVFIKNFEVIDLPSPRPIEGGDTKYARVLIKNQRTNNGK